jgi:mRNA interferase RelE/StbE
LARELRTTRSFDRSFQRLPKTIREQTIAKLQLFQEDPSHPSLRVKRIRATARIWEMSITMNYRVTFEVDEERVLLRRIGTHDVLKHP